MRRTEVCFVVLLGAQAALAAERPRDVYNRAVEAFQAGSLDAADKDFLEARKSAGQDHELRYRAAFNLGMTCAGRAEKLASEKPEEAVGLLRQAVDWFDDALQVHPGDEDSRVNLEVAALKIQELIDKLNQGKNGLEAQLDRIIEDQRGLKATVQELMTRVAEVGAKAEPTAFAGEFKQAETRERTLLADVNNVSDLAGDESAKLSAKPEDQRTDKERMRLVQLANLEHYLGEARPALADARHLLRRLQGDKAHRRADAALLWLKRGREQLRDPVTVLGGLMEDQAVLAGHTQALDQIGRGTLKLADDKPVTAPPWLTAEHLGDRQEDLAERTAELLGRLRAGVLRPPTAGGQGPPDAGPEPGPDAREERLLASVKEALPFVDQAKRAMDGAQGALATPELGRAVEAQRQALEALSAAAERFSELRGLIELTYAEQKGVVALLTEGSPEAAAVTSGEDRARLLHAAIQKNRDRLLRLGGLIADEAKAAEAQAAAADAASKAELYKKAEGERMRALEALGRLAVALGDAAAQRPGPRPLEPAEETLERIEALRRLFFSVVEHLKELLRNQAVTYDGTSSAQSEQDDAKKLLKLGPLVDPQRRHAEMATAIAQALEAQADQAGQGGPNAPDAQKDAAEAAKRFSDASVEVRAAETAMQGASGLLSQAGAQAQTMSVDLEPAVAQQKEALTRLENAIRILEPPQEQQQDQQEQEQEQEQQEQMSQEQANRQLQKIRDREAGREREKNQRDKAPSDPVEKDW